MTKTKSGKAPPRKKKSQPKTTDAQLQSTETKGKPTPPMVQRKAKPASPVQRSKPSNEVIPGFHTYHGLWFPNSAGISPRQIAHALKHVGSS